MIRYTHSTIGLCLILVLTCALVPIRARADERAEAKLIRSDATERFGPIGKVAWNSLGGSSVQINGRMVPDEQVIWNGDLIEATGNAKPHLLLDSLGQIALRSGAQVRLASNISRRDDNDVHPVLIATLISGDLAVNLQQNAVAYIEAGGSVITTTPGAQFSIGIREGQPVIDTIRGTVSTEFQRPTFKGRAARKGPGNVFVPVAEGPVRAKTKSSKPVDTLWSKLLPQTSSLRRTFAPRFVMVSNSRTQAEKPAALRLVHFEVDPPSLGVIIPTDKATETDGGVEVDFVAGPNQGNGTIRARIVPDPRQDPPGTDYQEYTRPVIVTRPGFFSRNKLWIAVGAAAIVVTCVVACPKSKPLQQQPPPNIP